MNAALQRKLQLVTWDVPPAEGVPPAEDVPPAEGVPPVEAARGAQVTTCNLRVFDEVSET